VANPKGAGAPTVAATISLFAIFLFPTIPSMSITPGATAAGVTTVTVTIEVVFELVVHGAEVVLHSFAASTPLRRMCHDAAS